MKNVCVLLTNRNTKNFLTKAVESLRANNGSEFKILIKDDGSTDGSKEWLESNKRALKFNYTTHNEPTRKGLVNLTEEAMKEIDSEIIFIGHSDMVYGKDCIKNAIKHLDNKTIVCSTRIEPPIYSPEPCKILKDYGFDTNDFKEEEFNSYVNTLVKTNEDITTDGMFAPIVFFKKNWIGYDMLFSPQSREDSDLFLRWKESGFTFKQSWDSLVYHFSGKGSRRKDGNKDSDEWKKTEGKNLISFIRKWGSTPMHTPFLNPIIPPKIPLSAVILVHNEQDYIYNLLNLIEPYFNNINIIDDNSKDNSISLIHKYIKDIQDTYNININNKFNIINYTEHIRNINNNIKDNLNKIYHNDTNKDFAAMRNLGCKLSTGEWIFHIDCDERIDVNFLNQLRYLAQEGNSNGTNIYGFQRFNTLDGQPTGIWPDHQFRFHKKGILWEDKVHEVLAPVKKAVMTKNTEGIKVVNLTIEHHKSTERQARQNIFYRDLQKAKIDSVIIDSVIYTNEGITKHIRETARSFRDIGYKIQLLDFYKGDKFGEDLKKMYEPINVELPNYVTIVNQPPTRWQKCYGLNNFIGYFAFEGNLPNQYLPFMNSEYVREIWTPSTYCESCFRESGVNKPIKVIPHGIDPKIWMPLSKDVKKRNEVFTFLGAGTWHNNRKGLDLLVKAFSEEFANEKDVKLILKLNNIYNPKFKVDAMISKLTKGKGNLNIEVIEDYLDEMDLVTLFDTVDCYVSPHRSEGFGLFILQAIAAGTPTICTGATGNTDFCYNDNKEPIVQLLPADKKYIPIGDPIYENATWVEPNYEDLKKEMRKAYEGKYAYDTMKASDYIRSKYSWDNVVNKMVKEIGKF